MDRETEVRLVDGLRHGDTPAFDAVYDEFNSRLYTFLLRLSRRRDVAEDLLEETWLRLARHGRRLRPDTRLGPWLFTVARHLYVSYIRSCVLEDTAMTSLLSLWPPIVPRCSPFETTAANELERRIERAIASLPHTSREVLLLVAVAGLDHDEAARVCGINAEALRQRLSRARALLARAIEDPAVSMRALREVTP